MWSPVSPKGQFLMVNTYRETVLSKNLIAWKKLFLSFMSGDDKYLCRVMKNFEIMVKCCKQ